jgi:DNA-binding FrmR family transcriptional regulator
MNRKELIHRLNRAQGQIEAIKKKLLNDEPLDCMKTMHLLKAAQNALKKFGENYVIEHYHECLKDKPNREELKESFTKIIHSAFDL